MAIRYDFSASSLAGRRLSPQLSHLGMIELHIDGLVSGGKQILILGLAGFDMPRGRSVEKVTINYLNGSVKTPGKAGDTEDITITVNDYVDGRQRYVLHKWFSWVYNEITGLGGTAHQVKTDGHVVLFGPGGVEHTEYALLGIWPTNGPKPPSINFSSGSKVEMTVAVSVDSVLTEKIGGIPVAGNAGAMAVAEQFVLQQSSATLSAGVNTALSLI